jgi:type 1 fimbria pilin
VPVDLPTVTPADFASTDLAGRKDFSIDLTCPAGDPVAVYMTITDNTHPENRSNNLSLASPPQGITYASGVAIRLVNRSTNTDVLYGPKSPDKGNPNQFKVSDLGPDITHPSVPLTAYYVKTGTVTGGLVKALATFTMSYQ